MRAEKIYRVRVTLKVEAQPEDGGIIRQMFKQDHDILNKLVELSYDQNRLLPLLQSVLTVRNLLKTGRSPPQVSFVPVKLGDKVTFYVPGSTLKGLLRYAWDISRTVEKITNNLVSIDSLDLVVIRIKDILTSSELEDLRKLTKKYIVKPLEEASKSINFLTFEVDSADVEGYLTELFGEEPLLKLVAYILLLQSDHTCLTVFENMACSLPLPQLTLKLRRMLSRKMICDSCMVYGCSGLRSPLVVEDLTPQCDIEAEIRVYAQIIQAGRRGVKLTAPFYVANLHEKNVFEGYIYVKRPSPLLARLCGGEERYYELLDYVLKASVNALKEAAGVPIVIGIGKRINAGFGRVNVDLKEI